jgi:acyl-coenzyme A thioesterase PaaI-like protein
MSSPLGGALLAKFGTLSDKESLLQYVPENEEARAVEDFINNHPLTAELRNDPKFVESRPHLKLPAAFRRQNLTAGMLLGPGRFVVPPVVFINDSESVVAISYLGPNLCGHPGLVHGGVLATMLDEGLARCCFDALPRKIAVTAKLEVNYRQPVRTGTYVVLRARTVRVEGRKAWVEGHLETLPDGDSKPVILAEASALYISPRPSTVCIVPPNLHGFTVLPC